MVGPLQLLALREKLPAMDALSLMLELEVRPGSLPWEGTRMKKELEVVESGELAIQMTTALTSTAPGKAIYAALCDRQIALRNLQVSSL